MSEINTNIDERLKNSYMHCVQSLQFSKDDVTEPAKIAQIEQVIMSTKCLAAVKLDAAPTLFKDNLKNYTSIVDDTTLVNNYWQQLKNENLNIKNNPLKWESGLSDISQALEFIKPLPCQSNPVSRCKNLNYSDHNIETFMNTWQENSKPETTRKVTNNYPIFQCNEVRNNNPKQRLNFLNTEDQPIASTSKQTVITNSSMYQYNSNQKTSRNVQSNNVKMCGSTSSFKGQSNSKIDNVPNEGSKNKICGFKTAREELNIQLAQKNKQQPPKKTLGGKSSIHSKYICPLKRENETNLEMYGSTNQTGEDNVDSEELVDERLKNIDPKMIELIKNEIMDSGSVITWDDIAGLEYAKKIIQEIVVFPMLRPDIFTGLRRPPKGILLFGPPGTGKTLIGKCIASQSKSTFFSISASSLTSKWIGEGEKMVRALFAVAQVYQPSVVFIDEIDSLLTQRSETEHESSRRIKTEFLVQLDGAATGEEDRILIVGATNRPYELDEAARRRLVKRLYIPLPECDARGQIVKNLLKSERHDLTLDDINQISKLTEGYSGADVTNLCKEASMGPIRSIPFSQLENISKEEVRHVTMDDFIQAIRCVRPSVSQSDLSVYLDWDKTYGTGSFSKH